MARILCGSRNFKTSDLSEHASTKDHSNATNIEIARAEFIKVSNNPVDKTQNHVAFNTITYENNVSGREILSAISKSIEETIWKELDEAVALCIMIDESTDISCEPHLIIYVKYCFHGRIKVRFLKLLKLKKSKDSKTIFEAIINLFDKKDEIDAASMVAFLPCKETNKHSIYWKILEWNVEKFN
ncbi:zinc finger protein 862-like [Rhizophagus clarus]|uniref:Zinc finger protein 862-like n=1 Tax=Rhizophagus clarus TaxID=94130 RepID=A0A8H3M5C6_9GLOM|nr:zinc finger protein 862-like [Rhizophagus clarus]